MKMLKRLMAVAAVVAGVALPLAGQEALSQRGDEPTLDGVIGADEYSYSASFDKDRIQLFLNWSDQVLSVGVIGETKGWVGVGFDSLKMDGAMIFIGYVDGEEIVFRGDMGRGHRHSGSDALEAAGYALQQEEKVTTMEIALDAGDFLPDSGGDLQVILAYGNRDSLSAIHRYRTAVSVPVR